MARRPGNKRRRVEPEPKSKPKPTPEPEPEAEVEVEMEIGGDSDSEAEEATGYDALLSMLGTGDGVAEEQDSGSDSDPDLDSDLDSDSDTGVGLDAGVGARVDSDSDVEMEEEEEEEEEEADSRAKGKAKDTGDAKTKSKAKPRIDEFVDLAQDEAEEEEDGGEGSDSDEESGSDSDVPANSVRIRDERKRTADGGEHADPVDMFERLFGPSTHELMDYAAVLKSRSEPESLKMKRVPIPSPSEPGTGVDVGVGIWPAHTTLGLHSNGSGMDDGLPDSQVEPGHAEVEVKVEVMVKVTADAGASEVAGGGVPSPAPATLADLHLKTKLKTRWGTARREWSGADGDGGGSDGSLDLGFESDEQRALAGLLFGYKDILLVGKGGLQHGGRREHVDHILALHVLNHSYKTRDLVQRDSERLQAEADAKAKVKAKAETKAEGKGKNKIKGLGLGLGSEPEAGLDLDLDLDLRDQAFTRPKILVVVPFRHSAYTFISAMLDLLPTQVTQVSNKSRFHNDFGPEDGDSLMGDRHKPWDYNETFMGNIDDCFRLGIQFTRKSIKLYTDFYKSDVVVASPLGLRVLIDDARSGGSDFLSGIEICAVLRADVLAMQNWDHVRVLVESLNGVPRQGHEVDFSRVRRRWLDGHGSLFRQTVLVADYLTPELNALFNAHCRSVVGRVKVRPLEDGVLSSVMSKLQQVFQRVPCESFADQGRARMDYLKDKVLSAMKRDPTRRGVFVFVPSYFEYVQLRRLLRSDDVGIDAALLSEYAEMRDVNRDRRRFYQERESLSGVRVMLYTERFHYYHRFRIRGMHHVIFFAPPTTPHFYSEILNAVEPTASQSLTLYTQFDAFALERVVGSERVGKMLNVGGEMGRKSTSKSKSKGDKGTFLFT